MPYLCYVSLYIPLSDEYGGGHTRQLNNVSISIASKRLKSKYFEVSSHPIGQSGSLTQPYQ